MINQIKNNPKLISNQRGFMKTLNNIGLASKTQYHANQYNNESCDE